MSRRAVSEINVYHVQESNPRPPGNTTFIHAHNFSYISLFCSCILFYSMNIWSTNRYFLTNLNDAKEIEMKSNVLRFDPNQLNPNLPPIHENSMSTNHKKINDQIVWKYLDVKYLLLAIFSFWRSIKILSFLALALQTKEKL